MRNKKKTPIAIFQSILTTYFLVSYTLNIVNINTKSQRCLTYWCLPGMHSGVKKVKLHESSHHAPLPSSSILLIYSSLTFNDHSNLGILMLITTFFFCEWGMEGILLLSIDLYIKSWQFNCHSQNMSLYPKSHHLIIYKKYRKERIEEKEKEKEREIGIAIVCWKEWKGKKTVCCRRHDDWTSSHFPDTWWFPSFSLPSIVVQNQDWPVPTIASILTTSLMWIDNNRSCFLFSFSPSLYLINSWKRLVVNETERERERDLGQGKVLLQLFITTITPHGDWMPVVIVCLHWLEKWVKREKRRKKGKNS